MNEGLEERVAELEIRLSFQDELLDVLNQTVIRQQQDIERLQQQMAALAQRLRNTDSTPGSLRPEDDIPPHY